MSGSGDEVWAQSQRVVHDGGPLDMLVGTSRDGSSGLVAELDPVYTVPRRPSRGWGRPTVRELVGLRPVDWWTGRDVGAYLIGHTLLHR